MFFGDFASKFLNGGFRLDVVSTRKAILTSNRVASCCQDSVGVMIGHASVWRAAAGQHSGSCQARIQAISPSLIIKLKPRKSVGVRSLWDIIPCRNCS
jgi:hypothetical protein